MVLLDSSGSSYGHFTAFLCPNYYVITNLVFGHFVIGSLHENSSGTSNYLILIAICLSFYLSQLRRKLKQFDFVDHFSRNELNIFVQINWNLNSMCDCWTLFYLIEGFVWSCNVLDFSGGNIFSFFRQWVLNNTYFFQDFLPWIHCQEPKDHLTLCFGLYDE